ncbi:MAG: hypothetical protein ABNH30_12735 [Thalassolituus sp.]|jgi:hypothetical protein
MKQVAMDLAQERFLAALGSGASVAPLAFSKPSAEISGEGCWNDFDVESVADDIVKEFPFLNIMIGIGAPPDAEDSAAWEGAVRWVLNELRSWNSGEANSLNRLRALLSATMALDANLAGISCVAPQVLNNEVIVCLERVIESTDVVPSCYDQKPLELRERLESLVVSKRLDQLDNMAPHVNFYPVPDFWAAVVFFYSAAPSELAKIIESRNDVLFSLSICAVLRTQAVALAANVNNLIFKFVSVVDLCKGHEQISQQDSQGLLETLFIQVAQASSVDWAAWMKALFRYPGRNASLDSALAAVLGQLSPDHWRSFFEALPLDYSHRIAAPTTNILVPFANSGDEEAKALMWSTAYQVWSDWDYGIHADSNAMFAPAACALDFPVALHYATFGADRLKEERKRLESAIETLEQQWFNTLTELVTERNRLKSRLRLVLHGAKLANGSDEALPQPVQSPDLYSQARYRYHDINGV